MFLIFISTMQKLYFIFVVSLQYPYLKFLSLPFPVSVTYPFPGAVSVIVQLSLREYKLRRVDQPICYQERQESFAGYRLAVTICF